MSQSSLFGGVGAGGNSFGFGVGGRFRGGGGVRGGGGGVGLSDILQAVQMDQSLLYASQIFNGGCGSSGDGGRVGGGRMRPRRRSGWQRGRQRKGTLSFPYQPHSEVRGKCVHILLHACLNQGGGIFCPWWRRNLSVVVHYIGGGGGGEKGSWRNL